MHPTRQAKGLVHCAFDLALISTVMAAVRRGTGYTLRTSRFKSGTMQSVSTAFLQFGDDILKFSVDKLENGTKNFYREAEPKGFQDLFKYEHDFKGVVEKDLSGKGKEVEKEPKSNSK